MNKEIIYVRGKMSVEMARKIAKTEGKKVILIGDCELIDSKIIDKILLNQKSEITKGVVKMLKNEEYLGENTELENQMKVHNAKKYNQALEDTIKMLEHYTCCGGPTAVGGHQPNCPIYQINK